MCHAGFTGYSYSTAKINALNELLDALKRGTPHQGALFFVNTLFAMEYVEACVQWHRDGQNIYDEVPPLPAQKISDVGFTATELARAHKDLLNWRSRGANLNERPASVTRIYVLVMEFLIRSLEANKHLSNPEDTEDSLTNPELWIKHIANFQELTDRDRLRQAQLQELKQCAVHQEIGADASLRMAADYRQNLEYALREALRRDSLENTVASTLEDID